MENLVLLLGLRVKDKVTGFGGVVTSVSMDLYGCRQVLVHPGLDKDGKLHDQNWFDMNRLTVLNEDRVMDLPVTVGDKGPADKPKYRTV